MSMLVKNNKLEDSALWKEAVAIAELVYASVPEFSEQTDWAIIFKLRQRGFDLSSSIAEAEGANNPRDIEWAFGQARMYLFALKNAYHVARKTGIFKMDTTDMVRLDKLLKQVDKQLSKANDQVKELEKSESKRYKV